MNQRYRDKFIKKYGRENCKFFFRAYLNDYYIPDVAKIVGISERGVRRWRKKIWG